MGLSASTTSDSVKTISPVRLFLLTFGITHDGIAISSGVPFPVLHILNTLHLCSPSRAGFVLHPFGLLRVSAITFVTPGIQLIVNRKTLSLSYQREILLSLNSVLSRNMSDL